MANKLFKVITTQEVVIWKEYLITASNEDEACETLINLLDEESIEGEVVNEDKGYFDVVEIEVVTDEINEGI